MHRRTLLAGLLGSMGLVACDKALNIIAKAGSIAQMVRKALDLFQSSLPMFGLDEETQATVMDVTDATERALAAFEASAKLTGHTAAGEQAKAREELLKAYEELYKLMTRIGVLGALGEVAAGPDEGDYPVTPRELKASLSSP